MAYLLDEKKFVNDNAFLYEDRLNSQYTRFLEKSPTFTTYFHISNIESMVDNGFQNVEKTLGPNSPLRFKEIKDFPIYGIDQIVLDLSDEEQGLDTSYEGEAVILPNTIDPLPNDYFAINHLGRNYLFVVTTVAYDTIKSNNYYRIGFSIKSTDGTHRDAIETQVNEAFNCILGNIGTDEKCLIQSDELDKLLSLNSVYTDIAEQYKLMFFNDKYNCFMLDMNEGTKIYDKYLAHFINSFELFNQKNKLDTVYLTNEDKDRMFMKEYHDSFYRIVEKQHKAGIKPSTYDLDNIYDFSSIFNHYRDRTVRSVKMGRLGSLYVDETLVSKIQVPENLELENVLDLTIIKYFNNQLITVYDLNLNLMNEYYDYMDYNMKTFTMVPVLLYILRNQYNNFMSIK